jgi:hypothetical protein
MQPAVLRGNNVRRGWKPCCVCLPGGRSDKMGNGNHRARLIGDKNAVLFPDTAYQRLNERIGDLPII